MDPRRTDMPDYTRGTDMHMVNRPPEDYPRYNPRKLTPAIPRAHSGPVEKTRRPVPASTDFSHRVDSTQHYARPEQPYQLYGTQYATLPEEAGNAHLDYNHQYPQQPPANTGAYPRETVDPRRTDMSDHTRGTDMHMVNRPPKDYQGYNPRELTPAIPRAHSGPIEKTRRPVPASTDFSHRVDSTQHYARPDTRDYQTSGTVFPRYHKNQRLDIYSSTPRGVASPSVYPKNTHDSDEQTRDQSEDKSAFMSRAFAKSESSELHELDDKRVSREHQFSGVKEQRSNSPRQLSPKPANYSGKKETEQPYQPYGTQYDKSSVGYPKDLHQLAKDLVKTYQHKYNVLPIYKIFLTSLENGKSIQDIKEGLVSISKYPLCLYLDQERPEFHQIRIFSGFYTYELKEKLDSFEQILEALGYRYDEPSQLYKLDDVTRASPTFNETIAKIGCELVLALGELDLYIEMSKGNPIDPIVHFSTRVQQLQQNYEPAEIQYPNPVMPPSKLKKQNYAIQIPRDDIQNQYSNMPHIPQNYNLYAVNPQQQEQYPIRPVIPPRRPSPNLPQGNMPHIPQNYNLYAVNPQQQEQYPIRPIIPPRRPSPNLPQGNSEYPPHLVLPLSSVSTLKPTYNPDMGVQHEISDAEIGEQIVKHNERNLKLLGDDELIRDAGRDTGIIQRDQMSVYPPDTLTIPETFK